MESSLASLSGTMPEVSVKLVLFDIDGTLIRTGGAGVRAFARAAEILFGAGADTRKLRFHGRTDGSLVSEFLRSRGLADDPAERARFLETYAFLLDEELHQSPGEVCPGVRELITALSSQPQPPIMGLLTGNIRLGAALKLESHGLAEAFALGAFGDDHLDRNELARIALARGAAYLGQPLSGNEVVVIGDTRADIECARAIGARCVAVATGGESLPQLLEHSPAVALESMDGISPGRILEPGRQEEKFVDWETLYRAGDTRWDHGEPAPALVDFLTEWPPSWDRRGSVAVPGCGFGHDARAWASAGFEVLGLDSSPSAIAGAHALHGKTGRVTFQRGDFLLDAPPRAFDGLFEHTLFCAIPPQCRDAYVRAAQRWIRPGGYFFAVHYLQPECPSGPPFAVSISEILERFQAGFDLVKHWLPRSFVSRQGRERAFLWIRKSE